MGSGEKPSASEGQTNLEGKAPIYSIDGTLSSANDGAGAATDGRVISFTYQQGGALTDEAINDGWTDGNVSVAIDGTRLSITIKNIDGAKVLAKGQSYEVTYRTVLDKNAFVAALVKAGGTAANAAYCIQNVASLSSGGAVLSGGSNASFTPSIPVMAEKSAATTPQGGLETQSASFTVKAGTGEVSREGFTLTDQITSMYGYNDSAAAAQKAMMLSALSAEVTLADGSEEVLDAARILSGEVAGVSLAMADGSELALNVPGSFGNNRGWKLTFNKLPAGATVTVDYTLTVDRAAYVAAGGDLDSVVTFRNAFAVSTADGSTAEDSLTGKVKVQPDVSKKGVVSSSKSEDGNPLINWSVDVRLQQIFGAVELSNLETASIKDVLDQRLKYLGVSVEDSRTTIAGTTTTPLEEGRDYEASFDEATRTLEVKIKNPSAHPDVRVTIKTEVVGSVDGIGNSVDVFVDGQYKGGDKTEIKDDLVAVSLMAPTTLPARTGTRFPRSRPMSLLRSIRRKSRILLTLRRPLRLLATRTCFPKRGTVLRRLRCSRSLSAVWGWRQSPDACAGSDGSVLSHEKFMQRARA